MYLVRTIQRTETSHHVQTLGSDPMTFIPLPFVPRRAFSGVVVIHDGDAYVFDLDRVDPGLGGTVACGARGQQPVGDKVRIYVKPASMQRRRAKIPGFRRIRYVPTWSQVAQ